MNFGLSFFQRKPLEIVRSEPAVIAEPEPAAADELEQLQDTVTKRTCRLILMEQESAELGQQLGEMIGQASQLKIKISEGNAGAVVDLDALDAEKIALERHQEGLRLRIVSLQAELQPLVRRSSELAAQRDAERQDQLVKTMAVEKDRLIEEILAHWTQACESSFDLMELLNTATNRQTLDPEHQAQVFGFHTDVGARLLAASLTHVNQQSEYRFAYNQVFRHLEIVPAAKRKDLAAAG